MTCICGNEMKLLNQSPWDDKTYWCPHCGTLCLDRSAEDGEGEIDWHEPEIKKEEKK